MKNGNPSGVLMGLLFLVFAIGCFCDFLKLRAVRKAGGLERFWMPWTSVGEVKRIRMMLKDDPLGKRIDLLGKIGTIAWITGVATIAFWKFS